MQVTVNDVAYLLRAVVNTVALSASAIILSTVLSLVTGTLAAVGPRYIRAVLAVFVYVFRGIPLLVVLFLSYYALPRIGFRLPAFPAALVGLTIYFTAFNTEVVRGAILAVPRGQREAAMSLGMNRWTTLRLVILPQALRSALPPLLNNWVVLVKGTSYASIIGVWELTRAAKEIVQRTTAVFEIFGVVMVVYFIICYFMTRAGARLEKRFAYRH